MRKKIYGLVRRLIAAFVCLNLTLSTVGGMGFPAFATSNGEGQTTTAENNFTEKILTESRVADPNTMDDYVNRLLSVANGSRYAGRVWTDKTRFCARDPRRARPTSPSPRR